MGLLDNVKHSTWQEWRERGGYQQNAQDGTSIPLPSEDCPSTVRQIYATHTPQAAKAICQRAQSMFRDAYPERDDQLESIPAPNWPQKVISCKK